MMVRVGVRFGNTVQIVVVRTVKTDCVRVRFGGAHTPDWYSRGHSWASGSGSIVSDTVSQLGQLGIKSANYLVSFKSKQTFSAQHSS